MKDGSEKENLEKMIDDLKDSEKKLVDILNEINETGDSENQVTKKCEPFCAFINNFLLITIPDVTVCAIVNSLMQYNSFNIVLINEGKNYIFVT